MSGAEQQPGAEPSMEEILSSIRRILKEDETVTMPAGSAEAGKPVLSLDTSMIVSEDKSAETESAVAVPDRGGVAASPTLSSAPPPGTETNQPIETGTTSIEEAKRLIGAQTAEATASHIGTLVRTISADRHAAIGRPGVTIEDLVRDEIRPLLKTWLDTHLPGLVERVVRAEIERLIGRDNG